MRGHRLPGLLMVLAWAVLGSGCLKPPPTRINFNEKIAKSVRKLAAQGGAFRKALEPLSQGNPANPSSAADGIGKTIAEVETEAEELSVPGKASASAPDYLAAFQAFVKAERKLYDTHVKTIVGIANGPGDPKAKWAKVDQELQALGAAEQPALNALKTAQQRYTQEHNYRVVPKHAS